MKLVSSVSLAMSLATAAVPVLAQQSIRIGEISSYSALPQGTEAYRKGFELALEEINGGGGVLGGRKLEALVRDDAGKPDVATRMAQELVTNEKVEMLTGTIMSHVGVAVADFAARNKIFFLASQPMTDSLVWEKGNQFTFRLRSSTYNQTVALVEEAAKLPARRWATIAPNYEYGQSAVSTFKALLKAKRPDIEFVAEQWPALGKLEAGSTVQALASAKPEALFNATFGADLARLAREGKTRGLFANLPVVSLLTGEPEYLELLRGDTPEGWIVTGYPYDQIKTPAHAKFLAAYQKKYRETPKMGSLMGYVNMHAVAAVIGKAGSLGTPELVAAAKGLTFESPMGPITFRPQDGQSTMGVFVGKLALRNGQGAMIDWKYVDGLALQPDDGFVKSKRAADAR